MQHLVRSCSVNWVPSLGHVFDILHGYGQGQGLAVSEALKSLAASHRGFVADDDTETCKESPKPQSAKRTVAE